MNRIIKELTGSASVEFMQKAKLLQEEGKDILDLAGGEPDFDTPELIKSAAEEAIRQGYTHYAVGKGILPLRQKIVEKLRTENNISCDVEDIIVTPGGKYGIYLAVSALINPGDEVLIFTPAWISYKPIIEACGGCAVPVELEYNQEYCICEQEIVKKISSNTKALIINYPNNPTGRVLNDKEAQSIVNIVKEYGLYVISDEIYEKIIFDNKKHLSIASYHEICDKVVTVNGFSKSYAMTGWRLGYTVACKSITDVMYKLFVHTITGVSTFIQYAALEAYNCAVDVQNMVCEYQRRRDYFVSCLNEIPYLSCKSPEGAFYVWVKFDCGLSSEEVAYLLLSQYGVIGVPGVSYGEQKIACIRFSFACRMEILEETIKRLRDLKIKE